MEPRAFDREIQSFRIGLPLIDFTPSRLICPMLRPKDKLGEKTASITIGGVKRFIRIMSSSFHIVAISHESSLYVQSIIVASSLSP